MLLSLLLLGIPAIGYARGSTVLVTQTFPTISSVGGGPPCVVGGNPDQKVCISSDQDNMAPLAAPWLTVSRYNLSVNWTVTYGAWLANSSALFEWTNAKTAVVDLSLNSFLHGVFNASEGKSGTVSFVMTSDKPLLTLTVASLLTPESVGWNGENLTWRYDAPSASVIATVGFSPGVLTFHFFGPGGGVPPGSFPLLPGLTNFPQLDLVPDFGDIVAFSCANVTLSDPRPIDEVAATRLWVFDWGDGTAQTRTASPTATHLYGSPGVYAVTMTVQRANGTALAYAGRVDTTAGSCGLHIARQIGFVILLFSTGILAVLSFFPRKRTKVEKKRMRRKALGCALAVVVLVVIV